MKQFLRITLTCFSVLALASLSLSAQVNISTKKVKIADFQTKTTKVVLVGDPMYDAALKSEISRRWRVSPFEFVTLEEYNTVKTSTNYYFLMLVDQRDSKKGELGVSMLSLFKGGVEDSKADNASVNVIDFPFCASEDPDGREYVFLPAIIDIIQNYTLDAMRSDRVGYGGIEAFAKSVKKMKGRKIYFSENDLDSEVLFDPLWEGYGLYVVSEEEADDHFKSGEDNTLVSYVVSPSNPDKDSKCYKMLIEADTHELCYFAGYLVGTSSRVGFNDFEMTYFARKMK